MSIKLTPEGSGGGTIVPIGYPDYSKPEALSVQNPSLPGDGYIVLSGYINQGATEEHASSLILTIDNIEVWKCTVVHGCLINSPIFPVRKSESIIIIIPYLSIVGSVSLTYFPMYN